MRLFLSDKYHQVAGTHRLLSRAIMEFIERHPIEAATEVFGELYETANVDAIRATFQKLLRKPTAYMIYAPPGSQKSFVLKHLIAELNRTELSKGGRGARAFYVYASQHMRPTQLLKRIAAACGTSSAGDGPRITRNLAFDYQDRRVVLAVDEAQHLDMACLEALRELLDEPPNFSLLLSGSHDLKAKFDQLSATLEQWNSRILAKVRLPGLEREEARAIVRREVGDLLGQKWDAQKAKAKVEQMIEESTVRDAFERNRRYINVRTLTNTLDAIKAAAAERASA